MPAANAPDWNDERYLLREAAKSYEASAERGDASAALKFADMCCAGEGVDRDPEKAARMYSHAIELGSVRAKVSLAALYMAGTGVPRDPAKAGNLLREAAEEGCRSAYRALAQWVIAVGNGDPSGLQDAYAWLRVGSAADDKAAKVEAKRMAAELPAAALALAEKSAKERIAQYRPAFRDRKLKPVKRGTPA